MAPPRRSRRSRRRRLHATVIENFPFTVEAGTQSNITVRVLANRPPRSNFRMQWFEIQAVSYIPGSGDPTTSPVAVQITLNAENDGECVAVSAPVLLGPQPRRVRLRQPPSTDWNAYNLSEASILGSIRAICVGPPPTSSHAVYVRGLARCGLLCQEEVSAIACPKQVILGCLGDDQAEPSSSQTRFSSITSVLPF